MSQTPTPHSNGKCHSIPFNFENKKFHHTDYPLNFENRLSRQHFKSFLQNCSKIVRKCIRNVDASDRLLKYTMIIYLIIMVVIILISIPTIIFLSNLVEFIYPFLVCIMVAVMPTIGLGYTIYQRGKKIKEFHSKCQNALENYVMQENRQTIRFGIQWFAKYDSDRISLFSHKATRYLVRHPRIEISDQEFDFTFETIPEEEEESMEEEDEFVEGQYLDTIRLLHQDDEN